MKKIVTVEATPNIAVVKYWGKRDESLILPTNSSISMTVDSLKTRTSVMFDPSLKKDEFWLNGKKVDLDKNPEAKERLKQLEVIRKRARITHHARIVSINGFPTAAGFASSASGLAALAVAASKAAGLKLDTKQLSILARLGSGSASRSVMGGFVEWQKGEKADGSDSHAIQLANHQHWPQMRLVSAVVNAGKKKLSSRAGMKQTIATSALYRARLEHHLPKVVPEMRRAIAHKDFATFADITMRESNSLHSVMADTWPPIHYMNDASREIVALVHELNEKAGHTIAAYTFDAGPNAHIYTLAQNVDKVKRMLKQVKAVKKVVVSKPGPGPVELTKPTDHLIDPETGRVRKHSFNEKRQEIIVRR
ncbi:MAG: diphosphomevalonate decarboxylase [Candidatus Micrarchaeota archaeon]|nr:diphosphomevalonate decarboxylase [Candidatus Micrarchaeota archaeon]